MQILPNGVAVTGSGAHSIWCATEGIEHDHFMVEKLEQIINRFSVKRVVNAGCHIGSLVSVFLRRGCSVIAFEPNPEACACILHNLGHYDEKLVVENMALGDGSEIGYLHLNAENSGASYVSDLAHPVRSLVAPLVATIVTLDQFYLHPDFILLDAEGYEPKILRGATETLARCRPVMVLEVNAGALERAGESREGLLALVDGLGYTRTILQPGLDWEAEQYDILAEPR